MRHFVFEDVFGLTENERNNVRNKRNGNFQRKV
jgi:hypothetical protein